MSSPRSAFELFKRLSQLPEADLASVLDAECGQNSELRREVEKLLSLRDRARGFLPEETSPSGLGSARSDDRIVHPDAKAGTRIGPYKILQEIGEGGFGVVYLADQLEPVRRQVALKVIKPGMDTRDAIARFEVERQTLALMDHPNIARVLDAATTENGRPYFVMELVKGVPITEFCDKEQLNTTDRLKLFMTVCHAVQHAHQKGIIHRDLKPSNVLVSLTDGQPVPKVIDFGIAKAINQRLTEKTLFTHYGQMIGTPHYMSPEQAEMSGLDVDTRSDIYSLGVLLYELLTGTTPIEARRLQSLGLSELQRIIQNEEAARPSIRLSSLGDTLSVVCENRKTDAKRLRQSLRGDLDWITMKCLEKPRSRRYDTANALAADLQRYLSNEPVSARPPSAIYRLQKAWRRNRVVYAAATCVVVALAVGMAVSLWQTSEAIQARADAMELLYAADLKLAQLAIDSDNLGRATILLDRHRPSQTGQAPTFEWRYLWQQTQIDEHVAVLKFATADGVNVAFSPDNRWLVIGTTENLILYDVSRRETRRTFDTTGLPHEMYFSDDGCYLFTSGPREMVLWNTKTWEAMWRLPGSTRPAAMSPDARTVVCNGSQGLQIRDAQSGHIIHEIEDMESGDIWGGLARTICFSADGTKVAALVSMSSETGDFQIRSWQVDDLRQQGADADFVEIQGRMLSSLKELVSSRDGQLLAGSSIVGDVTIWNQTTGQRLARLDLGSSRVPGQLTFSNTDNFLLASCWDQTVRGWQLEENQLVESWRLRGHRARVISIAASRDGTIVASGDISGTVIVWPNPYRSQQKGTNVTPATTLTGLFNHLQFLSDARTLVACNVVNKSLSFWDLEAAREIESFENLRWQSAARVSPDERWLAIGRSNGDVDLLDWKTRRHVITLRAHRQEARRIFFTPDSNQLFTATVTQFENQGAVYESDNIVCHWQIPSGRLIRKYEFPAQLNEFALCPTGDKLAVQLQNGTREVAATEDFRRVWSHSNPKEAQVAMLPMVFSPDGKMLAAATDSGTMIRVYDGESGDTLFTTGVLDFSPLGLAFTPDGRSLAVGGTGASIKFWSVASGQETLELPQPGAVYEIAFSGDAKVMAVSTYSPGRPADDAGEAVQLIRAPAWQEIVSRSAHGQGP